MKTKRVYKHWTREEFDLAYKLRKEGNNNAQIAKKLGRTRLSVQGAFQNYIPSEGIQRAQESNKEIAQLLDRKAATKAFSLSVPLKLSSISIKDGILTIEMEAEG